MSKLRNRAIWIVAAFAVTLGGGTLGFMLIEDYPFFDAFYMTLITVTTIGYSEIHTLSQAGRIFNSILILFGVTSIFLAVGLMTQTAIELELNQFFGKRRTKNMIDKLQDHIIVCGYGRVGRGAADELQQAGIPFVIVDHEEDRVERAMHRGMLGVVADASRDETLRDVGILRARGLIATLGSDPDNLFLVLTAKTLNNNLHLSARVSEESSEPKLRRAGADFVFAPYNTTGHRMAQALVKPHVMQFLDFTTQKNMGLDVGLEQVQVSSACKHCNKSLAEIQIRTLTRVIVLAIRKPEGGMVFNPSPDSRIEAGDHLIAMGEPDGLRKLENLLDGTISAL